MLKLYFRFISISLTCLTICVNVNSAYAINWNELGVAIRKLVAPAVRSVEPLLLKPKEIPPELKIPPGVFVQPARTLNEKIKANSGSPQPQYLYDTYMSYTPDNTQKELDKVVAMRREIDLLLMPLGQAINKYTNCLNEFRELCIIN